ncbi:MAG: N-acetylmuramoyl-L-alanine amidase [Boseongicola sp. SB0677_bin_26]|nr:N-acetylmuramoyl-L-alanine amidase [Boseongicola sp. SB0665_bin_10]MYG25696.1 N-acetylmuramoyl-L-alanine amidase [Boseongicola sp. SB0677_bin_26]
MRTCQGTAVSGLEVIDRPASCFGDRRLGSRIELVVIHYTAMENAEAALERLCGSEFEVSAHYLVGRDGTVYRMVREDKRAWHAGAGSWAGRGDVNSRSIGIELDNDGTTQFTEPLMKKLEVLLADILDRHVLHPRAVIGHSDMAPDRKRDPGRHFDWRRLAEKGLSVWPAPLPGGDFMRDAAAFGYPVQVGESAILSAFRQRFNPSARGPVSKDDEALMAGLARGLPAGVAWGSPGR